MKRLFLIVLAALFIVGLSSLPALAEYPEKPIQMIVPSTPGGGSDTNARLAAIILSERLGVRVVVVNKPGAGSIIGNDFVAKAAPDGYTLVATSSTLTIVQNMNKKTPFDATRDFTPISLIMSYPYLVVVPAASPIDSIKSLIAMAKAKPGSLRFSSVNVGSPTHLFGELFKIMAGVDLLHVAYRGGGPALTAVLNEEVQVYFGPMPTVAPQVKAGKLKAIAVTSITRSKAFPDVPTIDESGVKGYHTDAWNGLLGPAGMPAAIVSKLHSELNAGLNTPSIKQRYASLGMNLGGMTSQEFASKVKSEVAVWAKLIRDAGIKTQ